MSSSIGVPDLLLGSHGILSWKESAEIISPHLAGPGALGLQRHTLSFP